MRRPRVGTLLTILAILGPPIVGAGLYLYANTHPITPGINGCRIVRQQSAQINCYGDRIQTLVTKSGTKNAIAEIDSKAQNDKTLASACHLALHQVGARAARNAARDSEKIPNIPSSTHCRDGYVHGFQITYMKALKVDTAKNGVSIVSKMCDKLSPSRAALNCAHSFGHVVARAGSENSANRKCSTLNLIQKWKGNLRLYDRAQFECGFGMYMERSLIDIKKDKRLTYNCDKAKEPTRFGCYAFLPLRMLSDGASTPNVVLQCERAPNKAERQICVSAILQQQGKKSDACHIVHYPEDRVLCKKLVSGEISETTLLESLLPTTHINFV